MGVTTYLYRGEIIHLLSTMDIPVDVQRAKEWVSSEPTVCEKSFAKNRELSKEDYLEVNVQYAHLRIVS